MTECHQVDGRPSNNQPQRLVVGDRLSGCHGNIQLSRSSSNRRSSNQAALSTITGLSSGELDDGHKAEQQVLDQEHRVSSPSIYSPHRNPEGGLEQSSENLGHQQNIATWWLNSVIGFSDT
ncbi:hypothetical protein ILYODFUR_033884 [Ilyodon furcidens]|uniref:Uncharacterized protein n=1 Tax=Ilyodon furcidens TaxID=33524 RepID=A0ABV0U011_9TELE